jgi:hypothetical protein
MLNFFKRVFGFGGQKENDKDDVDYLIDVYLRKNSLIQLDCLPDFLERFFYRKLLNIILDQLGNKEFVIHGFKLTCHNFGETVLKCIRSKKNRVAALRTPQLKMVTNLLEQEVSNPLIRMLLRNSIVLILCFLFDTLQLMSFTCMGITFRLHAERSKKQVTETRKRILTEEEKMHINEVACDLSSKMSQSINIPFFPDSLEEDIYHQSFTCLISLLLKMVNELSMDVLGTGFAFNITNVN